MDIKQYIESGVLELYVLGHLSQQDTLEVEKNAAEHTEIAAEIDRIEVSLEELAFATASEVNPKVLDRTLEQLRAGRRPRAGNAGAPPAAGGAARYLPWVLAALALALAAWLWVGKNSTEEKLNNTEQELEQLRSDCRSITTERDDSQNILASLSSPDNQSIVLNGTDNAPDKRAVVFYNPTEEEAFFTASNLPAPPSGKQYQLWAIDADGPKSLGVLDLDLDGSAILPVDFIPAAAAFAITLEDLGGKPQPDLTQLQVIGEV